MRNIARFVVDPHAHLSTLYQPAGEESLRQREKGKWNGMNGEVEPYENVELALYDMDRFGVDMAVLLPSMCGTFNEAQLRIVNKYPNRFRACCSDQRTATLVKRGEIRDWSFQMSLDEVESALKTGMFVGIGEFVPGLNIYRYGCAPAPEFQQRVEEWDAICDLADKYDVPVHFHEYIMFKRLPKELWSHVDLLETVADRHPRTKIVFNHGYKDPDPGVDDPLESMRRVYSMVAEHRNIFMETGGWCEKNFELAFESGVRACNLMWGHDYGHVSQYIMRSNASAYCNPRFAEEDAKVWKYRKTDARIGSLYRGFPYIPLYQENSYAWGLRTMDRVGDWLTQPEIDLIMGGTAAHLYRLPVPYPRMFAEGRPDIFGDDWQERFYPFIRDEQIIHPEPFRIPLDGKDFLPGDDSR